MKNKIAALIPARLGSRGVKHKNIRSIDTLPMIAHTILAAKGCKEIGAVYVSSESEVILRTAEIYGATPLNRPAKLASNEATTESVIHHFLSKARCSTVVLIQPTSPMLQTVDLEAGLELYRERKYDSIFSGVKTNDTLIWDEDSMYPMNYDPKSRSRRQDRKRSIVIENGAFYIFSKGKFLKTDCRLHGKVGYSEMPYWRSFQVDNKVDLENIRILMTTTGT